MKLSAKKFFISMHNFILFVFFSLIYNGFAQSVCSASRTQLPSVNFIPRSGMGSTIVGNRIVLFGGIDEISSLSGIYEYFYGNFHFNNKIFIENGTTFNSYSPNISPYYGYRPGVVFINSTQKIFSFGGSRGYL